jgi:hypothetical protein
MFKFTALLVVITAILAGCGPHNIIVGPERVQEMANNVSDRVSTIQGKPVPIKNLTQFCLVSLQAGEVAIIEKQDADTVAIGDNVRVFCFPTCNDAQVSYTRMAIPLKAYTRKPLQ